MSKKRQPKSGGRAKRKAPKQATTRDDGAKVMHLSDQEVALLKVQRQRFIDKFGREPGPHDPVFFDETADIPQVPDESEREARWQDLENLIRKSGAPPAVMHAMKRTERIITSPRWFVVPGFPPNEHHMSEDEIQEWEDAMQEWHTWQARADKAEAEGEHPAFVEAIRRTGLLAPRREEFTMGETDSVSASGDSADWFEYVNSYMVEHPDQVLDVVDRMESILSRVSYN